MIDVLVELELVVVMCPGTRIIIIIIIFTTRGIKKKEKK